MVVARAWTAIGTAANQPAFFAGLISIPSTPDSALLRCSDLIKPFFRVTQSLRHIYGAKSSPCRKSSVTTAAKDVNSPGLQKLMGPKAAQMPRATSAAAMFAAPKTEFQSNPLQLNIDISRIPRPRVIHSLRCLLAQLRSITPLSIEYAFKESSDENACLHRIIVICGCI